MKDGSVFSEYRMNDAIDGRSAQAAVGLRNLWGVTDSWRLGTTFESTRPLFGPERATAAATAALSRCPATTPA